MRPNDYDKKLARSLATHAFEIGNQGQKGKLVYRRDESQKVCTMDLADLNEVTPGHGEARMIDPAEVPKIIQGMKCLRPGDMTPERVARLSEMAKVSPDRFREIFTPAVELLYPGFTS